MVLVGDHVPRIKRIGNAVGGPYRRPRRRRKHNALVQQALMMWLGHQSSRMVRHYDHLHDDEAQRQMQQSDS